MESVDAIGNVFVFDYDDRVNMTSITYVDDSSRRMTYDGRSYITSQRDRVLLDLDVRVQVAQARSAAGKFGLARLAVAEQYLPVQVRGIHGIEFDDAEATDAGCGQVHGKR